MSTKQATQSNVGKQLFFDEATFNRTLQRYKRAITDTEPLLEELERIGLPKLNETTLGALARLDFKVFENQFRKIANEDIASVGFVFRPLAHSAIDKGVNAVNRYLNSISSMLSGLGEVTDCPVIDGRLTITEDFEKELRERFIMRIKTEEGARFYEIFLVAQSAIQAMVDMGALAGHHYDFGVKGELVLNSVCE